MESVQLIYIRADGNKDIASGHIMRCLTIAREIRKKKYHVCFLVSDSESCSILAENEPTVVPVTANNPIARSGIGFLQLQHADYQNPEIELDELSDLLQIHPGTLLVDSYYVTDIYLKRLQSITKVAYLDDIRAFDYTVDLLINYDCFTDFMIAECRQNTYKNAGQLLLGARYAPLRPQFLEQKISIRETVKNVLVTTGSSDPHHFALLFCEKLLSFCGDSTCNTLADITYHIVVGNLNSDYKTLKTFADKTSNIKLYQGLTDLMPLMLSCDLAVTAGGTTLYELCALGIPSISFSMADNQIYNPQILDNLDIIPYTGDIRTQPDSVLECCMNHIKEYVSDITKRKVAHTKMSNLINGDGATQIADAILAL